MDGISTSELSNVSLDDASLASTSDNMFDPMKSWLQFNRRVINESNRSLNPIGERLKFIGIADDNLDEFIRTKYRANIGLKKEISDQTKEIEDSFSLVMTELKESYNIEILSIQKVFEHKKDYKKLKEYFKKEVYPLIQPLVLKDELPLPAINDGGTFIVTKLECESVSLSGIIKLPDNELIKISDGKYVFMDDVIIEFISFFYKGYSIIWNKEFRVFRRIDSLSANSNCNYLNNIKSQLDNRTNAEILMVDINDNISGIEMLVGDAKKRKRTYPSGLSWLKNANNFFNLDDALLFPKVKPRQSSQLPLGRSMFEIISKGDILLHFPYESFEGSTVRFLEEASEDPNVLCIKQTLYRVSKNSPLVIALINAAKSGKQVVVLLELKAKMDEFNNLEIADKLKSAGCDVIFGNIQLKTHAKVTLIIRKESSGIVKYANISTGNFNESTAKVYEDLSYFCKERKKFKVGEDLLELFNHLGAYSNLSKSNELLIAPKNFRSQIESSIDKAIEYKTNNPDNVAQITMKTNSFTDAQMTTKLYTASNAGVKIRLIVRGMCILKPGIPGLSDNIEVISIVGRYLEHSRIYEFITDKHEVYIGSGDIMSRNLDHRVEVITPIMQEEIKKDISDMINDYFKDDVHSYKLLSDGEYTYPNDKGEFSIQNKLIEKYKNKEKLMLRG